MSRTKNRQSVFINWTKRLVFHFTNVPVPILQSLTGQNTVTNFDERLTAAQYLMKQKPTMGIVDKASCL